jgi:hypothetical protein
MMFPDDGISRELENKRKMYESQETKICKNCADRAGLPCLFVFSCEKKNAKMDESTE